MTRKNKEENPQGILNMVGAGTNIKGDIESNGVVRIDGSVEGKITSQNKVALGETGKIVGDIVAQNADISGEVRGTINVKEILYLKSTARIIGDITTNKIVIEAGAEFNGACKMKSSIDINRAFKPGELSGNAATTQQAKQEASS